MAASPASRAVNTAFIERVNGTDHHLNARKGRKTYRFSKEVDMHVVQSWLSVTYYNVCWDHRDCDMNNLTEPSSIAVRPWRLVCRIVS